jgi:hypothetical protein
MKTISPPQLRDIKWPELLFYAEATQEAFRDARIITAASKYVDFAYKVALDEPTFGDIENPVELRGIVAAIINAQSHSVREYVDITRRGIWVCVDATAIDDNAMLKALDMIAEALEQLDGVEGRIYFGEDLTFTTVDTPWLFDK